MRFAIYHAPQEGSLLAALAAEWLGRDAYSGAPVAQHLPAGMDAARMAALTADACRYGFHATIVAPFRLAAGRTPEALEAALADFAGRKHAFDIPRLVLGRLGPFFALVPAERVEPLHALESACVDHFNDWKDALSPADIARRNPDALTARQRAYLSDYGYPYVKEEFRFHMTLTGPVPETERDAVEAAISAHFADILGHHHRVESLSIFAEPAAGEAFHVRSTHNFGK